MARRWLRAVVTVTVVGLGLAGCAQGSDATGAAGAAGAVSVVPAAAVTTQTPTDEPTPILDVVVTHERERETFKVPFRTVHRKTATLVRGVTKVARQGRPGVRVKVFQLTLEDGLEVDRKLLSNAITRKPVDRLVLHGTRVPPPPPKPQPKPGGRCDPNYSGCVPIASDVDCAGGSGDGPVYVRGPVRVTGSDIYDLDADGDGWGCD